MSESALDFKRAPDAVDAINRVEAGELPDVVLLGRGLEDPVRVAQRLHSLDRDGAVIVLADVGGEPDLRHALGVAPFLDGDVTLLVPDEPLAFVEQVAAAAARTRARRDETDAQRRRRATPPPLSASYLGTLLDSVPIGIVTIDATGAVIGWNRRAGDMLATPEVEALGRPFAELFEAPDRVRLDGLIERLGSHGIGDENEVFEREGRAFELSGARFSIRSGEPGALLILQDVTQRRRAEREVELQRALMAAQADASMVGIAVVGPDGTLERMNSRWTQIWGVDHELVRNDREAASRMMLDQCVDPDAFLHGIDGLAATGAEGFSDEIELKDGRVIERYATHVLADDGEVIGRIWFHTDITQHRREEDALRFLADATNLLSSSLDYETTLRSVVALAVPRMADWCSIEMVGAGGIPSGVATQHPDPEKLETVREWRRRHPDRDTGVFARAVASGEPQVFKTLTADEVAAMARDDEHRHILELLSPRSVMVVPIKVRDSIFGTIVFIRSDPAHPYDDDDVRLAEELARRAAIAIDNSRVHAQLRDTARILQESLLPSHLPAVRGVGLAARFRPAGVGMQVGGDFYDIFEPRPNRWGITVGDVCGKGAEAAALTALTRYTVRTAATYEDDTAGVLRVLNEALLRQRGDYRFTTVTFCVLDLASEPRTLRVACGGHPRPLLLRADGSVEAVAASGPLLGVVPDAQFTDVAVELGDGDAVVLYTDGLTDALAPQRMLEEDDLLAALGECRGMTAGEITQRLEEVALSADASRTPRDDIAIVVAKLA